MNLQDNELEQINTRRDFYHDALVSNYKPQRRIPEAEFVNGFYAFFRGEVKDRNEALAVHSNWITIAGSQFEEVQIYDTAGKDVYIVPPIAASDAVHTTLRELNGLKYNGLTADVKNAELAERMPHQKEGNIYNSLIKNVEDNESAVIEHKKKWDALISFFDDRLDLKTVVTNKANDGKAAVDLHDELF
jgi:hypothetical protein